MLGDLLALPSTFRTGQNSCLFLSYRSSTISLESCFGFAATLRIGHLSKPASGLLPIPGTARPPHWNRQLHAQGDLCDRALHVDVKSKELLPFVRQVGAFWLSGVTPTQVGGVEDFRPALCVARHIHKVRISTVAN